MLEIINRDLTTIEHGIICHGVNCQGKMGSGVANAIRNKWQFVYTQYKELCDAIAGPSSQLLGAAQILMVEDPDLYVANCFTQNFYGYEGRYAELSAINQSIDYVHQQADALHLDVYLPKIGAGLGGLDWDMEVCPLIESINQRWKVRVRTFLCVID